MRDERREFINEQADETRAERELFCMTCIMDGPRGESLAAAEIGKALHRAQEAR